MDFELFHVEETSTPGMTVDVYGGRFFVSGTYTEFSLDGNLDVTTTASGTFTAPTTNPKIDLLYYDVSGGTLGITAGSEGASPSQPTIPDPKTKIPIALIYHRVGSTSIKNTDDSTNSYIMGRNVRPFLNLRTGGISDVVDDTTPQLGGDLDANSKDITTIGTVGIGTAAPDGRFHVEHSSNTIDNPMFKIKIDNTNNLLFCRSDNDRADSGNGIYSFQHFNNGATPCVDYRVMRGTTDLKGEFAIYTSNSERFRVDEDGNFGIATNNPTSLLDVYADNSTVATQILRLDQDGTGDCGINFQLTAVINWAMGIDNSDGDKFKISMSTNLATTTRFVIDQGGNIQFNAYGTGALSTDASGNITASDARLKDIDGAYEGGLAEVLKLKPTNYHWNELSGWDREHMYTGFIAQELAEVIPTAVGTNYDGYHNIDDRPIVAALVNAVKELSKMIDELKKEKS